MIFTARQLMEKTQEHGDRLFLLFFNLKKVYDSVPRATLWAILEKHGVPLEFLDIIGSFHERVYAGVRVGADVSVQEWLEARVYNGHSHFNTMVARWRVHSEVAGVTVLYKHGRRLVGGRTVKSRLEGYRLQSLGFQMILHCMLHPKLHLSLLDGALLSFWANC